MKDSKFRSFCSDMWYKHKDEVMAWTHKTPAYGVEYYFKQNKWFLKSRFIEQYSKENAREIQKQIKRSLKKGNL